MKNLQLISVLENKFTSSEDSLSTKDIFLYLFSDHFRNLTDGKILFARIIKK